MRIYTAAIGCLLATLFVAFGAGGFADAQPATDTRSSIWATVTLLEGESTVAMLSRSQQPPSSPPRIQHLRHLRSRQTDENSPFRQGSAATPRKPTYQ